MFKLKAEEKDALMLFMAAACTSLAQRRYEDPHVLAEECFSIGHEMIKVFNKNVEEISE